MSSNIEFWKDILKDPSSAKSYVEKLKTREEEVSAFLDLGAERAVTAAEDFEGPLSSIPFGVKDNIAVKGFKLTCGSKMLEHLVSPYTATAVEKLQKAGAVVVGKTNLDEFGMGSSTDNSALLQTNNPWDSERVSGGSSGGSAAAVAAGQVPFALGSDTGGSVRQPASFCGVYGLKPTYGSVSRYGLTAYASSLEVIGVCANSVEMTKSVFDTIKGIDEMDHSTLKYEAIENRVKKIGILKVEDGALDKEVADSYNKSIERIKKEYETVDIEIPSLKYVVPAYYTIATAEASANLARYNGIRYGHAPVFAENPEDLMRKSRHEGFGDEVKLRVLLGTFVLRSGFQDQYYIRAQKIRTIIREELSKQFESLDAIMMPVFPTLPFKHGEGGLDGFQQKVADKYTCLANLAGVPALAVPSSVEAGLPVGVQFMAPYFGEDRLFSIAEKLEKEFSVPVPERFPVMES